jgi:hypothetical protein
VIVRALALLLLVACDAKRATPPPSASAASASVPIAVAPDAAKAEPEPIGCTGAPTRAKPIGHTSVVFKVDLDSGGKAAWKPNARKVRGRYRGEVAAYRLARALGIDNVPTACLRIFDVRALTASGATNEEVVVEEGRVHGVMIPWIEGLHFWAIEEEPARSDVDRWLHGGVIPPEKMGLAAQVSTLVAFDFLTSNWDRYSGANVGLDGTGGHVLFVDNDAAFMEGPPKEALAKNRARALALTRYSKSFVARLRALDRDAIERAIGEEEPGRPLLPGAVLASVAERARELAGFVDAKIAAQGEAPTLLFP